MPEIKILPACKFPCLLDRSGVVRRINFIEVEKVSLMVSYVGPVNHLRRFPIG